ncbi:hypothetical protein DPMN_149918 [Dreissena polymorpha]|uniref:Uncharacterized protein n=1 Tax=Dreissena polymorpha TaxID=45954 RepID=A0A9D4FGX9_DREPO|nr:hypothetical protein DPMN_149918 [Dreissena polymorpha]
MLKRLVDRAKILTKFHEDWTIHMASSVLTRKNCGATPAPLHGGHVFLTAAFWELRRDIIRTHYLIKFLEDWTVMSRLGLGLDVLPEFLPLSEFIRIDPSEKTITVEDNTGCGNDNLLFNSTDLSTGPSRFANAGSPARTGMICRIF